MRLRRRYVCGALVLAGMGASYLMLTPRLRLATRAQIEAALPASLRVVDPPDPAGESRYARLVEIVGRFKGKARPRAAFADLDAALGKGSLVAPNDSIRERRMGFEASHALIEELLLRASEGDREACLRDVLLCLRFGQALTEVKGYTFDSLVSVILNDDILKAVYAMDTKGRFDAAGRRTLLAALPPLDGTFPQLGEAMRRDFREFAVPRLVDPEKFFEERTVSVEGGEPVKAEMVGSYNALETARLMARLVEMNIEDTQKPFARRNTVFQKLYHEAGDGLPELSEIAGQTGSGRSFARVRYRWAMNSGHNTIGRTIATGIVMDGFSTQGARRAASRNLLRAVLSLRLGLPTRDPDPYGAGALKVDPKRRIVWSVGDDGVDQGGKFGAGTDPVHRDIGYKY